MVGRKTTSMDAAKRKVTGNRSYPTGKVMQKRNYKGPARGVETDMRMPKKAGSRSTYGITNKSGGKAPTRLSAAKTRAIKGAKKAKGRAQHEIGSARRKATKLWRRFNQ